MIGIDQRIPDLSDEELENLHANAIRLAQSGSNLEREQAESLLPMLAVQMTERHGARVIAQAEARRLATEKRAAARKAANARDRASAPDLAPRQ